MHKWCFQGPHPCAPSPAPSAPRVPAPHHAAVPHPLPPGQSDQGPAPPQDPRFPPLRLGGPLSVTSWFRRWNGGWAVPPTPKPTLLPFATPPPACTPLPPPPWLARRDGAGEPDDPEGRVAPLLRRRRRPARGAPLAPFPLGCRGAAIEVWRGEGRWHPPPWQASALVLLPESPSSGCLRARRPIGTALAAGRPPPPRPLPDGAVPAGQGGGARVRPADRRGDPPPPCRPARLRRGAAWTMSGDAGAGIHALWYPDLL